MDLTTVFMLGEGARLNLVDGEMTGERDESEVP